MLYVMVLRSRREVACQARTFTTWAKERLVAVVPRGGFDTHVVLGPAVAMLGAVTSVATSQEVRVTLADQQWARDMSSAWTLSPPPHRAELVVHDPANRR